VALTGGIATGKSACLREFQALGASVVDADTLAHQAVQPGSAGLAAVAARFGPGILTPDGRLDRAALGRLVFADAGARRDLEAIIHPIVYADLRGWFAAEEARAGDGRVVAIADVPLLFETDHAADYPVVIVAACAPEQQIERLMARDGLSREEAGLRIAAQWPIDEKRRRADEVIDTSGTIDETNQRVAEVWKKLERR
jgi:dephospho-CoA kinase